MPITASDIRLLKSYVEENAARPMEGQRQENRDIPCVLNVDVQQFSFLRIAHSDFLDDVEPWISATATGGHNWLMFESEYLAGQTGVCKVIPYDMPVMLRTGGSPQNGHRYNLPSVQEDENGEFTCVGMTMDAEVFWYVRNAGVGGGGSTPTPSETFATVILPICRAINPHAQGDWNIPFGNVFETQFNSRSHFAAACGYIAIDGKNYSPAVHHVDDSDPDNPVTHYRKALRVRSDVNFDCFGNSGIDGANALYETIGKLQRPVIEYVDGSGEWTPWTTWATTTDINLAWKDYDIAACKTLDYSEVLVPGERVKVLATETHSFYSVIDDVLTAESKSITIVEAPEKYTVQFEGCANVNEFGVWNKERKITGNTSDVVSTTIDENFVIGQGTNPYQYWGFDVVELLPNGNAAWGFIDIAAFPTLTTIEGGGTCYNTNHVSRPTLSDDVFIQNNACNTRAYGLWYKTDKNGLRYPILCSVESLTFGTGIETRRSYCNTECDTSWTVFEFEITRQGSRLKLPTIYCSVGVRREE